MSDSDLLYDNQHIAFLEDIWGEGFLSPGGAEEAARVLDGIDVSGRRVLDIGCGSGAIAVMLVRDMGAASVTGIDVEDQVCAAAQARVDGAGLETAIDIRLVEPGPLPFAPDSFDIVYSKDSILHIPDKEALARDVFRVLAPGGWFAASDWLISHDGAPSPEMAAYLKAEDLDFAMASPARYRQALEAAGFGNVGLLNRNPWYRDVAADELALLSGPERERLSDAHGADFISGQIETWTAMIEVLRTGEHCPHHLRGQKPA
ncbi:methyltransferase domain-containing protein [Nioella sp.]|uniref:methyltransferase domain-containing protein n=1 Tax=Nioella sp. TaxID=1912091 RepID=UPI0035199D32